MNNADWLNVSICATDRGRIAQAEGDRRRANREGFTGLYLYWGVHSGSWSVVDFLLDERF